MPAMLLEKAWRESWTCHQHCIAEWGLDSSYIDLIPARVSHYICGPLHCVLLDIVLCNTVRKAHGQEDIHALLDE
jgi:hypothetical protein